MPAFAAAIVLVAGKFLFLVVSLCPFLDPIFIKFPDSRFFVCNFIVDKLVNPSSSLSLIELEYRLLVNEVKVSRMLNELPY